MVEIFLVAISGGSLVVVSPLPGSYTTGKLFRALRGASELVFPPDWQTHRSGDSEERCASSLQVQTAAINIHCWNLYLRLMSGEDFISLLRLTIPEN